MLACYASLSQEEKHVLALLLEGLTNKQIAGQLDLGLRTIEMRRAQLMKKIGAQSLAQLVRLVVEAGCKIEKLPEADKLLH